MKKANASVRKIARERMEILFNLARREFHENPKRARRYVELIRRISMKNKVRIPLEIRRFICRKCNSLLIPSSTLRVRVKRRRYVVYECMNCGFKRRFQLNKKGTKEVDYP